ncbi:MAG: SDR family oxidoreductase [Bacteroidota bacterium]
MSTFNLTGKNAIVTGGGSGIGEAIASTLAGAGALVNILDLSYDAASKVAQDTAYDIRAFQCDVSNQTAMLETVQKAADGKVDILVNNAGIAHVGNIENTAEEDFDKLFQINVKGVYNGMKATVPYMKESGGVIINVASIASHVGLKDRLAYTMTKGAVFSMSMAMAKDYLEYNIRCNTISPARIHTPFVDGFIAKNYSENPQEMMENLSKSQPIGRMGKPEEVGNLVLYLCSDEASFITGTDFPIDGGYIKLNS